MIDLGGGCGSPDFGQVQDPGNRGQTNSDGDLATPTELDLGGKDNRSVTTPGNEDEAWKIQ